MDDHPADKKPKCANCKGDHPSNHKACNTRWIRMGLKPQQSRMAAKGKGCKSTPKARTNIEKHLDVGLTNEEISKVMKVANTPQAQKENMARFIQSHTTDHLNSNKGGKTPRTCQNKKTWTSQLIP